MSGPMRSLVLLVLFAVPAQAQNWALRGGDAVLGPGDISTRIVGQTLVFHDNGRAKFSAGGAYSYSYDGGGTSFGSFTVGEAGMICITFRNGWSRCDKYVDAGGRLVLLTEKGERYPIR